MSKQETNLREQIIECTTRKDAKILDLRHQVEDNKYIKNSTWIAYNEQFDDRFCELPSKNKPLSILISSDEKEKEVVEILKQRGWIIKHLFISNEIFWNIIEELNLFTIIPNPYQPEKLLFSPCPFLLEQYNIIEKLLVSNFKDIKWKVMDIGCGSGRDIAWLSIKNSKYEVNGIDYNKGAIQRSKILFKNLNLNSKLKEIKRIKLLNDGTINNLDEQKNYEDIKFIFNEPFHLVLCVRTLERACFQHIRDLVVKDGLLLYSTFVELGDEFIYDQPPKDSGKRLNLNELNLHFGKQFGFEIIKEEIQFIEDGRPVNSILARKVC